MNADFSEKLEELLNAGWQCRAIDVVIEGEVIAHMVKPNGFHYALTTENYQTTQPNQTFQDDDFAAWTSPENGAS